VGHSQCVNLSIGLCSRLGISMCPSARCRVNQSPTKLGGVAVWRWKCVCGNSNQLTKYTHHIGPGHGDGVGVGDGDGVAENQLKCHFIFLKYISPSRPGRSLIFPIKTRVEKWKRHYFVEVFGLHT